MGPKTEDMRRWTMRPSSWSLELVFAAGWAFVAVGYLVAVAVVPDGWDEVRVAVLALALAAFAGWAYHLVVTLCMVVVVWVGTVALVTDTGDDLVAHDPPGLLRLLVLAVAAAVGALVGRRLRPAPSRLGT